MKNKNFDSVFGNKDLGLKQLIEEQASTEDTRYVKKEEHNVKQLIKSTNLKAKRIRRKNNS